MTGSAMVGTVTFETEIAAIRCCQLKVLEVMRVLVLLLLLSSAETQFFQEGRSQIAPSLAFLYP
jgi:hypothetical protein